MKRPTIITAVVILVAAVVLYARPVPPVQAQSTTISLPDTGQASISWPDYGQAAFGAVDYGVLATDGSQKAAPIASIAKIVTALSVLRQKPLAVGQQGPDLTIGTADVALYQKYVAENGSVVPVNDGEQISEYHMLQAMLLPSGNNIADSLATWAFGSQTAYLTYANNFVSTLGLNETHLADASGFSPKSVSSAHDLVILGENALANPVLASIVGQSQAVIPIAGTVNNVNWLLGTDGVIGIKTGNTDQAGGCFLFAANRTIGGQQIKVVGAILGAPDSSSPSRAIDDSQPIIEASNNNFQALQIIKKGQAVGTYRAKWGASSPVVASHDTSVVVWKGTKPLVSAKLNKLSAPAIAGKAAGSLDIMNGQKDQNVPVILSQKVASPSVLWRIFHI